MKPITFDRFARGLVILFVATLAFVLFNVLSSVLIPFLVSAVLAYLLNPVCNFLQYRCRLRIRAVCVVLTLVGFAGLLFALMWLCVPPMVSEVAHFKDVARLYMEQGSQNATVPRAVSDFFAEHLRASNVNALFQSKDFVSFVKGVVPQMWDLFLSTAGLVLSLLASLIGVLYLFFLLLDYDRYARQWMQYVPAKRRPFMRRLADDVAYYMCGYFRGQLLIAVSNCVMFTAGLWLVDFPMPIALGCFIGIISFVPYLQVVGMLPATLLALLRAVETGKTFGGLSVAL